MLVLRNDATYTDAYGNLVPHAVAVVDDLSQKRRRKRIKFAVGIYASQQAYENGAQTLWSSSYVITGLDYRSMVQNGDLYEAAEQYLLDLEEPDFVDPALTNKPWGDWEKGAE